MLHFDRVKENVFLLIHFICGPQSSYHGGKMNKNTGEKYFSA